MLITSGVGLIFFLIFTQYTMHERSLPRGMMYNKYMLFAGWEVRMVKNCD